MLTIHAVFVMKAADACAADPDQTGFDCWYISDADRKRRFNDTDFDEIEKLDALTCTWALMPLTEVLFPLTSMESMPA